MTLGAIIRREWKAFCCQGKVPDFLIVLLLPVLYVCIFGVIYQQNVVKEIPIVIYDQDQSSASRQLIQMYNDSEKFHIVGYVTSSEDKDMALSDGSAFVALEIPRDFSHDIKLGCGSSVAVSINNVNNTVGGAALLDTWEINRSFNVGVAQKLIEGIGMKPDDALHAVYPVTIGLRVLNNPTAGFSPFMLEGLGVQGV